MEDLLARADRNMAEAWSAILAIAPGSIRREGAGYVSLSCELPVPLFNPTFVLDGPTDPTGFVDAVLAERGAGPALIYSRDRVHADAGAARGLVENYQPPLMVLDPIPESVPPPPDGLVIERVTASSASACAAVLGAGYGMPPEIAALIFGPDSLAEERYVAFLGSVDGVPVTTAAVFVSEDIAGIYAVATDPVAGRKGYGGAVTVAAAAAGRQMGPSVSVLQASSAGAPLYERLGYAAVDRYRQLERYS